MSGTIQKLSNFRHIVPVAITFALFWLGIAAIVHLLRTVDMVEVIAQMRAMPTSAVLISVLATAIGYAALVGYDFLALRYLGKTLPARVVGLGGFLACAFGNTVGVSVISGGAVRYRIYRSYGLSGFEVAGLTSYIVVSIGVGLTWIGITATAIHPAALEGILPLSSQTVRIGATIISVAIFLALFGLSSANRTLRLWRITLSLPSRGILFSQMLASLLDVIMAALALYILLPDGGPSFVAFVAIYAAAATVAILSHVPGGVGVFETVVLAAMPAGMPVGEVAAALLLFRIIYYLLPFGIAFVVVSFNEARSAGGFIAHRFGNPSSTLRPAFAAISGLAPALASIVVLGVGGYLLALSFLPSLQVQALAEAELASTIFTQTGSTVTATIGVALMLVSIALWRRLREAYWFSMAVMLGALLTALLVTGDRESAFGLAIAVVALIPFASNFDRRVF